jgi:ABC-2 type transport system permease protein
MSGPSVPGPAVPAPPPAAVAPGPAAPVPASRPAALSPLVRLFARGLLGRRRSLAVALLAASPILVGAILAFGGGFGRPETIVLEVFGTITLGLVIPLVALVLGTAVLGTAIDDGTIAYLLVKPVPRRTIAAAALLVATAAAAGLTAPGVAVSGFLVLGPGGAQVVGATVVGGLLAAVLYAAVFVALSVVTSRALVAGLAYVLVWEGLVTTLLEGTRTLSIREYALAVVAALGGEATRVEEGSGVGLVTAIVMSTVVLVGSYVVAAWRLGRFEVTEAT